MNIDPLHHTLRRAVGSIGLALLHDEQTDEARALFMAWPMLSPDRTDVWERMLDTSPLGDHTALKDLEDIAAGVVRYDDDHVRAACQRAQKWTDEAIERMGGTPDPAAEARRQERDQQLTVHHDSPVPEQLSAEEHLAWFLRISTRLVAAVRDIALACGNADLASDIGMQLTHVYNTPGWWAEGTHIALLAAEGAVSNPVAKDLIAEVRAIIIPLHWGLAEDEDLRYGHLVVAHERSQDVLGAIRRYVDMPDKPIFFRHHPAIAERDALDTEQLIQSPGDGGRQALTEDRQSQEWVAHLLEVSEQQPFAAYEVLEVLQQGYQRYCDPRLEPPEAAGAQLHAWSMVDACIGKISDLLKLNANQVKQACKDGTVRDLPVDADHVASLTLDDGSPIKRYIGAGVVLVLVIAASVAFAML